MGRASNFIRELRRRRVFRGAAIYVVGAWVVLQVASLVFPAFNIPEFAIRYVWIGAIVGFPIAVVLGWRYELTDGQLLRTRKSGDEVELSLQRSDYAILLAVMAVAVSTIAGLLSEISETQSPVAIQEQRAVNDPASIAVLSFDNLSPDPNESYFADGLAEELLSVLSRIGELKVASRTSTAYFKGKDVDHLTIASTLFVDNVLSGSVRRAGDLIRITAVLDSAVTGRLLWTDTYDRTLEDVFDIQTNIAKSVASAIVPLLSPESEIQISSRPTDSIEAYEFYLRGLDYLRRPYEESTLAAAVELFDRAIAIDPDFAQAFAGRCEANLGRYDDSMAPTHFENAEIDCNKALALNGTLWEVHTALGSLYRISGKADQAVTELQAAIGKQPNAVSPYLSLGRIHGEQGRWVVALETLQHAETLESGNYAVHNELGHLFYDQSIYDKAIARYQRVAELVPDQDIGYNNLGNAYLAMADWESAEQAFADSPVPTRWTYTNLGLVNYYQGKYADAVDNQRRSIELAPDAHDPWGRMADAYRYISGREEEARAAYESAIELAEQELVINPSSWVAVSRLSHYYGHTGRADKTRTLLDGLFELTSDETGYYFASIAALSIGDRERALNYLRESIDRGFSKKLILSDPDVEALQGDPGFDELINSE